jgi:hypothetical protein
VPRGPQSPATEPDPVCYRPDCTAPNHCEHHEQPVHHAVDSIARLHRLKEAERG